MFQKLHLRLTLLCTGITAIIMIVMSLCYLAISEKGLYRSQFYSFQNDMNTIATNLEQQSVISMEWLAKMESQGNYSFFLLDNGVPFLYNSLKSTPGEEQTDALLQEALTAYQDSFLIEDASTDTYSSLSLYTSYQFNFQLNSTSDGQKYFCSVLTLKRDSSCVEVLILSSLHQLYRQIWEQRMIFLGIDFLTVILLAVFSFLFTGKLLQPVIRNQENQTRFIAAASHELRTPLAVILSAAECCQSATAAQQTGFLSAIHSEGLRMKKLIDDLLTLSCSDDRHFNNCPKPVELDTLALNSYESFLPLAKEQALTLSLTLPEEALPVCFCDPDRISQVLSILLHNAVSYTPAGGRVQLTLSCFCRHGRHFFHLQVADNGIGISDEDKKKIFDRFYRAEKARSTKGHFGLGLSIALEVIQSHHGTLTVSDAPGGGSVFTVELPEK